MFKSVSLRILLIILSLSTVLLASCVKSQVEEHNHSFSKTGETFATCTTDGVIEYSCYCGEKKTQTIKSTGNEHQYSTDWDSSQDYHWHNPSCGHEVEVKDKQEHTVKDGTCVVCSFVTDRQAVLNKAVAQIKDLNLFGSRYDIYYTYGDNQYLYKGDGKNLWLLVSGKEDGKIVYTRSSYIFPIDGNRGTAYIETVDTARNWEKIIDGDLSEILQFAIYSDKPASIEDLPFYSVYKLIEENDFEFDEEMGEYISGRYSVIVNDGSISEVRLYDSEGKVKSTITYKFNNNFTIGIPSNFSEHNLGEWQTDHEGNKFRQCTCHERDFVKEYESVPEMVITDKEKPNLNSLIAELKEKYFFTDRIGVTFSSDTESRRFVSDGKNLYYCFDKDGRTIMDGCFIVDGENVRIYSRANHIWYIFTDIELNNALESTVGSGNGENSYLGEVIEILENKDFEFVDTFVKCFVADGVKVYVEKLNGVWRIKEIEGLLYQFHTVVFDYLEYTVNEPELGHVFGEWQTHEDGYLYRSCDCGRGIEHSGVYPSFGRTSDDETANDTPIEE